jgi:ABC-type multidrug transport system fused ATPase/permease subunit
MRALLLIFGKEISLTVAILIVVGFIVVFIIIAALINSGKYASRYKSFYRKLDKKINKKYNGNLLNEEIINSYAKDQTNTFKSLKAKGKRKVKKYLDYYVKTIPEQVIFKSFTTSDKTKNQIVILLLDDSDKVLYRWYKKRKASGIIKASNKYQMLNAYLGFLFELPLNIHESAPYRFVNHDNDYVLTYQIVKNPKKGKRKVKEKKLSRKELKALAKVEKTKEKKARKRKK